MDTKKEFYVRIDSRVKIEDLPSLSSEMKKDFWELFIPILEKDPYDCAGFFGNHNLEGRLDGWKGMEILKEENGYEECYRLVYKIIIKTKTVEVISFNLHNLSYDAANVRVVEKTR